MVICIDKLTAVKMYEKVRKHWGATLADLKSQLAVADDLTRPGLEARIRFLESTDMAVVVSQQQNEVDDFRAKGFDITPHRERMVKEDLETKFKNPDDPFRLVFVCAMWLTGFDAPCVSTIYLDKPMKNHTLMQTIARANRVFGEKNNGLIVDYVGVFRDLQKALAIYGTASGGGVNEGESPIQAKDELVRELQEAIADAVAFCDEREVDLQPILSADGFQRIAYLENAAAHLVDRDVVDAVDDGVEKIIINDDLKKRYLSLVAQVVRLYKAILPDPKANEFAPVKACLVVLADKIRTFTPEANIWTGGRNNEPVPTSTPRSKPSWTTCPASSRQNSTNRNATRFTSTSTTATQGRGSASTRWDEGRRRTGRSRSRTSAEGYLGGNPFVCEGNTPQVSKGMT